MPFVEFPSSLHDESIGMVDWYGCVPAWIGLSCSWSLPVKKIATARPLVGYRVALSFDDGTNATVDLSDLAGRGVFTAWLAPGEFERVEIGSAGELTWPCGVDLCPDALYLRATGRTASEVFPSLRAAEPRWA